MYWNLKLEELPAFSLAINRNMRCIEIRQDADKIKESGSD